MTDKSIICYEVDIINYRLKSLETILSKQGRFEDSI